MMDITQESSHDPIVPVITEVPQNAQERFLETEVVSRE